MAVTASDIKFYESTTTVSSKDSLGGARTSTEVDQTTTLHNLFDRVEGAESSAGDTNYRVIYVRNEASQTAFNVTLWLSDNNSSQISFGVNEAAGANAQSLTNESTAPSNVTFSQPSTRATGVDIGDLTANQARAVYLKREIAAGASAVDNATFELSAGVDTGE